MFSLNCKLNPLKLQSIISIHFIYQIPLNSSVDVWLSGLLKSIHESLYSNIQECINDIDASQSIEEWAGKVLLHVD